MFRIMIRGSKCSKYIKKCLDSLNAQTNQDWMGLLCLDGPDTKTKVVVDAISKDIRKKFFISSYEDRLGPAGNMWRCIQFFKEAMPCQEDDIMVVLDADDWLDKKALDIVASEYKKHPEALITHGSYLKESVGRPTKISAPYPKGADVRKHPWRASHLKTFKASLLKYIREDWFKHKGEWLGAASDVALMLPLIELAGGLDRVRFIGKSIYHWRDSTPYKCNRDLQIKCEKIVRNKPIEKRL